METESRIQEIMGVVKQLPLIEQTLLVQRMQEHLDTRVGVLKQEDLDLDKKAGQALLSFCHEARAALSSMVSYAKLLKGLRYGPLTDQQREIVQRVLHQGQFLQNRVDVVHTELRRRYEDREKANEE
jgi:hypothetical protein